MPRLSYISSLAVFIFIILIALPGAAQAEWPDGGAAVCEEAGAQFNPAILETSDGGAIVAWADTRNGLHDIYAQRIDAWGRTLWTPGGVSVCVLDSLQSEPQIITDMAGGAIITWYDKRNGNWDVYAQRVDGEGAAAWSLNGVPVAVTSGDQRAPRIVSDGDGGAIIAWWDWRGADDDIYAQRLNSLGAPQWTTNGVAVSTASYPQLDITMIPDGFGGAVLAWDDYRDGSGYSDVYAQRINSSGAGLWTANGVALCVQPNSQWVTTLVSDGAGGAVATWYDYRGTYSDIYSQRVDGYGNPLWTINGELICGAVDDQKEPVSISSGEGAVIIAWIDERTGYREIYAQKINMAGTGAWTTDGEPVSAGPWQRSSVKLAFDELGGAIVTWADDRAGNSDVYAQRVNEEGSVMWPEDVSLCAASEDQMMPATIRDGAGGAIVTWSDMRTGGSDVYAQRVTRQGYWGYPCAEITLAADVPGDQGGQVWLEFSASRLDTWMSPQTDYYSVWRSIPLAAQIAAEGGMNFVDEMALDGGLTRLSGPNQANAELVGTAYFVSAEGAWQLIGTIDAHYLQLYGFLAQTARDSTSLDPAVEQYFVSAHGTSGVDWWDSFVAEGYSVDNLAPCMPGPVAPEYTGGTEIWIHWSPNAESDLHHYAVYRGTTPDFVPDETNRMGAGTDTSFVDVGYGYGSEYYYKISAWDIHENESLFALVTPEMIAGTPGAAPPRANALFQNAPNPFVTGTKIAFSLERTGHVRLSIFDAKGRLVRTLVDAERSPDLYTESWDGRDAKGRPAAAGMYFYRIETPGWSDVKKMTLAR